MDVFLKVLTELLERYLGAVLKALWQPVWQACIGIKKLAFPVKDLRTGIKQSRMRYYLVRFSFWNRESPIVFQEIDSNGNLKEIRRP